MIDYLKDLLVVAIVVALIASGLSLVLSMVLGPVYATIGFQTILGGVIALILLIFVGANTELDSMKFFDIIVLLVAVGLVGSVITTIAPATSEYIISVDNFGNLTSIAWTLVYIGLAMFISNKYLAKWV